MKKAVVLVSGGLDSTTTLAIARAEAYDCYALTFSYGQRHVAEIRFAGKIAEEYQVVEHRVIDLDLGQLGGSALTDSKIDIPETRSEGIPVTYVPARNTIFLAYALAYAEVMDCDAVFIGVNAVDYSGYPDCRPEFIDAFRAMAALATRAAVEGKPVSIHTPLIHLGKADIIRKGTDLGVDYSQTVSCYRADDQGRACGTCDACQFRKDGFVAAGITDPTIYCSK